MSLWSWVRALTEAKEKGMGHAPIACEWDHPSSEWARGWGPYNDCFGKFSNTFASKGSPIFLPNFGSVFSRPTSFVLKMIIFLIHGLGKCE